MPSRRKPRSSASVAEQLDIGGVADEWDDTEDIRTRLREGGGFFHPEGGDDVQGCCRNSSLLIPLLTRMATLDCKSLPGVDDLRDQIEKLFVKNKRGTSPEDLDLIIAASWRVKKLCGFVKMKSRREEVSTATRLSHLITFFISKVLSVVQNYMQPTLHFFMFEFRLVSIHIPFRFAKFNGCKVETFQNLCLILDPMLQDWLGNVGPIRFLFSFNCLDIAAHMHARIWHSKKKTTKHECSKVCVVIFPPLKCFPQGAVDKVNEKLAQRRAAKEWEPFVSNKPPIELIPCISISNHHKQRQLIKCFLGGSFTLFISIPFQQISRVPISLPSYHTFPFFPIRRRSLVMMMVIKIAGTRKPKRSCRRSYRRS